MADVMSSAKNKFQEVGNQAVEAANTAADNVRNAAGYVVDQVKDMAKAGSARAEDATHAIGGGLRAASDAIRQNLPQDGRLGQATSAVAQGLSETGDYIEREGLEGIGSDLTNLIKRNPIPALLLGIGLGFLVARATTSRD